MRSVAIVCLACAVLAPAAGAEAERVRKQMPFYASIIPADAIAVISASDPAGMIEAAQASSLGRLLAAETPLRTRLRQLRAVTALATSLPEDQRELLLKGSCAVVILASPAGAPASEKERLPFVILLDISKLNEESRRNLEHSLIASIRLVLGGQAIAGDPERHFYQIKLGEEQDQHFAIAFRGDVIIVGFEAEVSSLPCEQALAENDWYQMIAREVDLGSGISGYVSIDGIIKEMNRRRPSRRRADSLKRLGIGDAACLGFRTAFDAARLTDTLFLALRRPRSSWMRFLPAGQGRLEEIRFVPNDFDLYVSFDLGSGDDVLEEIRSALREAGRGQAADAIDNWIESVELPFGISVKNDIFGSIDGELFFAIDLDRLSEAILSGGINAETTPYLIGFKTSRREALENVLNRVLESQVIWDQLGIEKQRYMFGEHELVKLSSFVEPRIMVGFGFVDGYFLFSPRHTTVERAVDAYRTGRSLKADTGYADLKKTMPEKANVEAFVRTSVLYRELLSAYSPWFEEGLQPMVKTMLEAVDKLDDSMASIVMRDDGVAVRVSSPVGLMPAVISAGKIKQAATRRKVDLARQILEETSAAIGKYHETHKSFPRRLSMLVPEVLPRLPVDPFATYAGMPLRYHPGPRAPGGRRVHAKAYVLASNGPDRREDYPVDEFDPASWAAKLESDDDAVIAELKARLYQFRKDRYADEGDIKDEGDIVLVHIAEPGQGGGK